MPEAKIKLHLHSIEKLCLTANLQGQILSTKTGITVQENKN